MVIVVVAPSLRVATNGRFKGLCPSETAAVGNTKVVCHCPGAVCESAMLWLPTCSFTELTFDVVIAEIPMGVELFTTVGERDA
jgi:hypothetical protein